jgi:hypothetical protein
LPTALIATSAITGLVFLAVLTLGWYIVRKTERTEGLVHLAELVKALMRRR